MSTNYNGWKNFETWCVAVWLLEVEKNYRHWHEIAKRVADTLEPDSEQEKTLDATFESATIALGKHMRDWTLEKQKLSYRAFIPGLSLSNFEDVDWAHIAHKVLAPHFPGRPKQSVRAPSPVDEYRFPLGEIVATPRAQQELGSMDINSALTRHVRGNWGVVNKLDAQENEHALKHGRRLLSVYQSSAGTPFWVITEADRSVTTVLLPEEY